MVMGTDGIQPPQAWTCGKCGAALPAEAATGEMVTCGYCGTAFKLPTAQTRRGGVSISGGAVTIGGDVIGGSKRVIMTGEAPSAETIWDEPDTSNDEGVSIEGEGIQVFGDVVGGSVMQIVPPPPAVKVEPVAAAVPEVVVEPAPKLDWWEKVKRLFSN
jgi:hypothetical protein